MAAPYPIINDTPPRTQAIAGLNQFIYSTDWTANQASDILVYSTSPLLPANEITDLVSNTNYTVQFIGSENFVQVTFNALVNPPQFNIVTIVRATPADWLNNYTNTNFTPSMLNSDFDILTLVDQQNQMYNQQLTPRYNADAVINYPIDLLLPILGANQLWVKNSTNTAFIAVEITDLPNPYAPDDSPFITYAPDSFLTNAINIGSLGAGILAQNVSSSISTPYILSLPLGVTYGGTGDTTFTPYSVLCAGTTSNGSLQNVSGLGTSGQVLASNGASALPTWQSIADITASALTEVNDTNVTMTLGGTPTTALLQPVSMTLGWTGQLSVPRGGTGDGSFTAYSLLCGGTTSTAALQNVSGVGTSGQALISNGASALPSWQTITNVTPAALTEVNDTNITLTLGGSPSNALLQATSITAGWTGLLAITRGGTGVSSVTTAPTASSFAGWDANSNLSANHLIPSLTTTASSASSIILTVASSEVQNITGTIAQTIQMPVVSTLPSTGFTFVILNNSTAIISVFSSGSNLIGTIAPANSGYLTCTSLTGTTAASWFLYVPGFTPAALSEVNDTNVTLSLSGLPTSALLEPVTMTLGWTGTLAYSRGGLGASITASNGGIFYSAASNAALLSATSTAGLALISGASGAPSWGQAILTSSSPTFAALTLTNPYIAGSGGLHSFQIFTTGTAATYTKPSNVTSILVEMLGGGGGGAGALGGASTLTSGGGGGAGGYARLYIPTSASTYTYTIGGGGAAGTAGANPGSTGGTTTFSASSLQATGGAGGQASGNGTTATAVFGAQGLGGSGSNGDVNSFGSPGSAGLSILGNLCSGNGGSTLYGAGGEGVTNGTGNGGAAAGFGSGGAGGGSSTVSKTGGAGAPGLIIIWEFA